MPQLQAPHADADRLRPLLRVPIGPARLSNQTICTACDSNTHTRLSRRPSTFSADLHLAASLWPAAPSAYVHSRRYLDREKRRFLLSQPHWSCVNARSANGNVLGRIASQSRARNGDGWTASSARYEKRQQCVGWRGLPASHAGLHHLRKSAPDMSSVSYSKRRYFGQVVSPSLVIRHCAYLASLAQFIGPP
jgi:hypothetical protein